MGPQPGTRCRCRATGCRPSFHLPGLCHLHAVTPGNLTFGHVAYSLEPEAETRTANVLPFSGRDTRVTEPNPERSFWTSPRGLRPCSLRIDLSWTLTPLPSAARESWISKEKELNTARNTEEAGSEEGLVIFEYGFAYDILEALRVKRFPMALGTRLKPPVNCRVTWQSPNRVSLGLGGSKIGEASMLQV